MLDRCFWAVRIFLIACAILAPQRGTASDNDAKGSGFNSKAFGAPPSVNSKGAPAAGGGQGSDRALKLVSAMGGGGYDAGAGLGGGGMDAGALQENAAVAE